jgi:hypothetical protein
VNGTYSILGRTGSATLSGVTAWLNISLIGPLAIVALTAVNSNHVARSIDVSLDAELRVYGSTNTLRYDVTDHRGFYASNADAALNFTCSGHPLHVGVDTYWFGSYSS